MTNPSAASPSTETTNGIPSGIIPSLCSCTPEEASKYLLECRFQGNGSEVASFLLQAIDQLPNIDEINKALAQGDGESDDGESESVSASPKDCLGAPLETLPQVSLSSTSESSAQNIEPSSLSTMTISAITPRSKFTLQMYENGCTLTNAKDEQIVITSHDIQHIILFPKREDCFKVPKRSSSSKSNNKKSNRKNEEKEKDSDLLSHDSNLDTFVLPGSIALFVLKEVKEEEGGRQQVMFRNKPLTQICFSLPQHDSDPVKISNDSVENNGNDYDNLTIVDSYEEQWVKLFQSSLLDANTNVNENDKSRGKNNSVIRVYNPKVDKKIGSYQFVSDRGDGNTSLLQGGMPYVKCYSGVNDGVLFPLEEGLLFFKPPRFIHRSMLHSISCGRGSGGSRYVDLVATLDSSKPNKSNNDKGEDEDSDNDEVSSTKESIEFTNIDREELQCLNDYIHNVLVKAMAKDANDDEDDEDDDEEEDDDASSANASAVSAASAASAASSIHVRDTNDDEGSDDEKSDVPMGGDDDDGSNGDVNGDGIIQSQSRKRKSQRAASVNARKATKVQLRSTAPKDESDDDDDDDFIKVDSEEEGGDDNDDSEIDVEYQSDGGRDSEIDAQSDTESEEEEE